MSEITDLTVAKKMLHLAQSAKDRNLDFNLTFKTVRRLLTVKHCYYTNVEFDESIPNGPNCRTIDRIDASIGYVENNVVACTQEINSKKVNLTIAEVELLYKKMIKFKPHVKK